MLVLLENVAYYLLQFNYFSPCAVKLVAREKRRQAVTDGLDCRIGIL